MTTYEPDEPDLIPAVNRPQSDLLPLEATEGRPRPTPDPVFCVCCMRVTTPDPDWHCRYCGQSCWYGYERRDCPRCTHSAPHLRRGNTYDSMCDCNLTEAARAKHAAAMARRREEEAEEKRREEERQHRQALREVQRESADDCWTNQRRGHCDVTLDKPQFPWCQVCKKFGKARI